MPRTTRRWLAGCSPVTAARCATPYCSTPRRPWWRWTPRRRPGAAQFHRPHRWLTGCGRRWAGRPRRWTPAPRRTCCPGGWRPAADWLPTGDARWPPPSRDPRDANVQARFGSRVHRVLAMTSSTDKTADLLAAVLADLARVVGGITPEQLHDPTPCTELDVGQLRNHVLGWLSTFAAGFPDPNGQAPRADINGYQAPADPATEVHTAADLLDRAIRSGAAERPLRLGRG